MVTQTVGGRDRMQTQGLQALKSTFFLLYFNVSHGRWERVDCWCFLNIYSCLHGAWWNWSSSLRMSFRFWGTFFQPPPNMCIISTIPWSSLATHRVAELLVEKGTKMSPILLYIHLFIHNGNWPFFLCICEFSDNCTTSSSFQPSLCLGPENLMKRQLRGYVHDERKRNYFRVACFLKWDFNVLNKQTQNDLSGQLSCSSKNYFITRFSRWPM